MDIYVLQVCMGADESLLFGKTEELQHHHVQMLRPLTWSHGL